MVLDAFTKELIEIMDINTMSQFVQLVFCLRSWSSSKILLLNCFAPASMSNWSLLLLHSLKLVSLTYWYKLPYIIFQRGLSILFQIFSDSRFMSQFSLIRIVSGPGSSWICDVNTLLFKSWIFLSVLFHKFQTLSCVSDTSFSMSTL